MKRVYYFAQRIFPIIMCSCMLIITIATTIYMAKDNVYSNKLFAYFNITPRLHVFLMNLPVDKELLLRAINFSSTSFYCIGITFPIVLTIDQPKKSFKFIISALIALFLVQIVILDPFVVKNIYMGKWLFQPNIYFFKTFYQSAIFIFHIVNKVSMVVGFILLLRLYFSSPKISHIRLNIAAMSIGMLLLQLVYIYMFGWAPVQQLWLSRVARFIIYKPLPIGKPGIVFNYYPYITLAILILFGIGLYRYLYIKKRIELMDWEFSRKVDTAETTVRALCHYTKNELLAIQSEVEQLQTAIEPKHPEYNTYFKKIYEVCDSAYNRLNEANRIIGFRRIPLYPILLCHLLEEITDVYRNHSDIDIELILLKKDVIVMGEELYLKEAFNNLIRNAVEAFNNYPIKNKLLKISCNTNKGWAVVTITDNGPGISEKNLNNIFEPFFSTKPLSTNWGIGLALCKRIILMHNGKLEAKSNTQGTTFTIAMPFITF